MQEATLSTLDGKLRIMEGIAYRSAHAVLDAQHPKAPILRMLKLDDKWRRVCDDLVKVGCYDVKESDHVVQMLITALRRRNGWHARLSRRSRPAHIRTSDTTCRRRHALE
jgi:hypothetical protein